MLLKNECQVQNNSTNRKHLTLYNEALFNESLWTIFRDRLPDIILIARCIGYRGLFMYNDILIF